MSAQGPLGLFGSMNLLGLGWCLAQGVLGPRVGGQGLTIFCWLLHAEWGFAIHYMDSGQEIPTSVEVPQEVNKGAHVMKQWPRQRRSQEVSNKNIGNQNMRFVEYRIAKTEVS